MNRPCFILRMCIVLVLSVGLSPFADALSAQDTLIYRGSNWKFLDDGKGPGTGWTEQYFPDQQWGCGLTPLGYDTHGNYTFATTISYGPDILDKYPAYYFRRTIELPEENEYLAYKINFWQDDGLVVYLNNVEVVRSNLPDGPVHNTTYADKLISGSREDEVTTAYLEPALLRPGTNTIAVSVHQTRSNSSDVYFDMEIVGIQDLKILHKFLEKQQKETLLENDKITLLNSNYELNVEKNKNEFQSKLINTQWVILIALIVLGGVFGFIFYRYYQGQLEKEALFRSEEKGLEQKLKRQENEIIGHTISAIRGKNFLKELKYNLVEIMGGVPETKRPLSALIKKIELQSETEEDWEHLKVHFDSVYSGFFERLSVQCPELSQQELRHCGFIKVQLDTKEISQIFRIDPKSVQAARYRIKKKLNLSEKEDLRNFIIKF